MAGSTTEAGRASTAGETARPKVATMRLPRSARRSRELSVRFAMTTPKDQAVSPPTVEGQSHHSSGHAQTSIVQRLPHVAAEGAVAERLIEGHRGDIGLPDAQAEAGGALP